MKPCSGTTVVTTGFVPTNSLVKITIWQLQRSSYTVGQDSIHWKSICVQTASLSFPKPGNSLTQKKLRKVEGLEQRHETIIIYTDISSYHLFILSQELYKQESISILFWLSVFFSDKKLLFPFFCKNVKGENITFTNLFIYNFSL